MSSKSDVDNNQQSNIGFRSNLRKRYCGNFFVIGVLWIELMKKLLVGKKSIVVPKVYNSKITKQEEKTRGSTEEPCSDTMRQTKCPNFTSNFYDLSRIANHFPVFNESDRKRFLAGLEKNIKNTKTTMVEKWKDCKISDALYFSKTMAKNQISKVNEHVADPNNAIKEKALVSFSAATGIIIGSKKGFVSAICNGGLGALASSMFCLHKKTENMFRNMLLRSVVPDGKNK